jgi:hypothetical protein
VIVIMKGKWAHSSLWLHDLELVPSMTYAAAHHASDRDCGWDCDCHCDCHCDCARDWDRSRRADSFMIMKPKKLWTPKTFMITIMELADRAS